MIKSLSTFAAMFLVVAVASAEIKPLVGGSQPLLIRTKADAIYLPALSQLESGDNDRARGRHGEIGRYQCLKSVWHTATIQPYASATNAAIASAVTLGVIRARTGRDPSELTPAAFAIAWHCPSANHLNREQTDYVKRFTNLCQLY